MEARRIPHCRRRGEPITTQTESVKFGLKIEKVKRISDADGLLFRLGSKRTRKGGDNL